MKKARLCSMETAVCHSHADIIRQRLSVAIAVFLERIQEQDAETQNRLCYQMNALADFAEAVFRRQRNREGGIAASDLYLKAELRWIEGRIADILRVFGPAAESGLMAGYPFRPQTYNRRREWNG